MKRKERITELSSRTSAELYLTCVTFHYYGKKTSLFLDGLFVQIPCIKRCSAFMAVWLDTPLTIGFERKGWRFEYIPIDMA